MAQQLPPFTDDKSVCLDTKTNQEVIRLQTEFPSNIWKDSSAFTSNIATRILEFDQTYGKKMEELKDELREMIIAPTNDPTEKVGLINSLCRLGVSYHFVTEIEEQLTQIFESQPYLSDDNDYDLYTVALMFRVLRQHGYNMSCDNFNKFKDSDGKFKEILTSDAKGMLSLYEAAHLRRHGEDILEEALVFSKVHLQFLAEKSSLNVAKQIMDALEMPLHKGMPRLEARKYISFYQVDDSRNHTLLLFAKLDFNRLQLLHQQELSHLSSWWKILNLPSKLPYIRDRLMEAYLSVVTVYFEPCYSRARLILCKLTKVITFIDDTFDSYGTFEELQLFTHAVQRWDISALDELPDYMKIVYSALLNTFDEISEDLTEEEISYKVSYMKNAMKEIVTVYFVEAEWLNQNYVPPFDEYMRNGSISVGMFMFTAATFLGMREENAFEWLQTGPKILRAAYFIARGRNDLMNHKFDLARAHGACSVECYMNEYGLTTKETIEKLNTMFENAWKDINEANYKANNCVNGDPPSS
ncbi:hypothetical protein Dsin_013319 [Dipteronia sinensis]|uniref:Uncharacterized protein n=1 Tax=Dipteronia sinensis TaxID=43782 RepID=A0AAE0AL04_9ROSI|nr:hypothetical protein Dsin_013319 [Dipteronia sinensis]